ncbi:hypothetical protein M3Y99_01667800 [Aphelenchoides fujianensis]|nr:hypothetical protein M3Y99_01667800 [Aphelenchoides fujianensis]
MFPTSNRFIPTAGSSTCAPVVVRTFQVTKPPPLPPARPPRPISYKMVNGKPVILSGTPSTSTRCIFPAPLKPRPHPSHWQTIIRDDVATHMFCPPSEGEEPPPDHKRRTYVLFVYQFSGPSPTITFIPATFDVPLAKRYACLDCFRVYCILKLRNPSAALLPTFDAAKLTPDVDVRTWPHYCQRYDSYHPEIDYFELYKTEFDPYSAAALPDLAFNIGMFLLKMGDAHRKLANHLAFGCPKDLQTLLNFVMRDYRLKPVTRARHFLQMFRFCYQPALSKSAAGGPELDELLAEVGEVPPIDEETFYKSKRRFSYEEKPPEINAKDLQAAVQRFRLLVLYYAPHKAAAFARLLDEVLARTKAAAEGERQKTPASEELPSSSSPASSA